MTIGVDNLRITSPAPPQRGKTLMLNLNKREDSTVSTLEGGPIAIVKEGLRFEDHPPQSSLKGGGESYILKSTINLRV